MGFIEDLRKSTEERLVAEQQRKTQEATLQAAQEEQRRQQEAKEEVFHEGRRKGAEAFRQESGIGELMEDLRGILRKRGEYVPSYGSGAPGYDYKIDQSVRWHDTDSMRDQVSWDHLDSPALFGKRRENYKYIIAETCPDGTVIILGGFGQSVIPLAKWRNDRNELEEGLKKSFDRPINFSRTYTPPPPEFRTSGHG